MSTKTTFKRLALVTVGALGLSLVAVAPSNAAVLQAGFRTLAFQSPAATATVGTPVSAVLKMAGSCVEDGTNGNTVSATATLQIDVAPAGTNLVLNSVNASDTSTIAGYDDTNATKNKLSPSSDTGWRHAAQIDCVANTSAMSGYTKVTFTPDVPGTYVVVALPLNATTGAATWTVVASAKTVGWNTAFIGSGAGTKVADAAVSTSAAASTSAKATLTVAQGYGTSAGVDTATADAKAIVVSVDKGLVSKTNDYTAGAKSVTTVAGTGTSNYYFFSNGDVGAATVSITVGGVALTSKTITYVGAATKLVATLTTGQKTAIAPLGTTTLAITATDAAGTTVPVPGGLTVTSSDTSVATAVATTDSLTTISGVAAGNATITIKDPATSAAATSATYAIHVAPAKSASAPVISFDKSAYNVGDLITMTITSDMADSATATLFTAPLVFSASVVVTSAVNPTTTATHAIVGGKATYTFYAPSVSGSFTVKGTTGADVALTTAADVSKTIDIVNTAVDEATAAAQDAAQNASDATDAALAAADAADLATAAAQDAALAVADLSAKVDELIKALKAQITTLTNLVIKIQKKVKA